MIIVFVNLMTPGRGLAPKERNEKALMRIYQQKELYRRDNSKRALFVNRIIFSIKSSSIWNPTLRFYQDMELNSMTTWNPRFRRQ
ncbi:hypothetical protein ACS0TY_019075 [Phlomoides rotata]